MGQNDVKRLTSKTDFKILRLLTEITLNNKLTRHSPIGMRRWQEGVSVPLLTMRIFEINQLRLQDHFGGFVSMSLPPCVFINKLRPHSFVKNTSNCHGDKNAWTTIALKDCDHKLQWPWNATNTSAHSPTESKKHPMIESLSNSDFKSPNGPLLG